MKNLVCCIFLISSVVLTAQEDGAFNPAFRLTDGTWKTDYHCFVSDSVQKYVLTAVDDQHWNWGNFITFTDSTFVTDYFAPCGLDCFTDVHGTYRFVDGNKIEVYVDFINRNGFCMDVETGVQEVKRSYSIYSIEQTETGLVITKDQK